MRDGNERSVEESATLSDHESAWSRAWRRLFRRAVGLARRLLGTHRAVSDEEDVVAAAFASLLRAPVDTPPPGQTSRLWPLVAAVTRCKVAHVFRREHAKKRGGGRVAQPSPEVLTEIAGRSVDAQSLLIQQEQLRTLDPELQQIAEMRMHGYSNLEIAEAIGRSLPTVERRLSLLRRMLKRSCDEPGETSDP